MSDQVEIWHTGLTEKQRKFCEAFAANGGNALQAAKAAGYSNPDPEGARQIGKDRIREALEMLRQAETSTAIATRTERQETWTTLMRNELLTPMERMKASELLGKAQGDFIERVENNVSGNAGGTWTVVVVSPKKDKDQLDRLET
jgi:phage terminase small subunit